MKEEKVLVVKKIVVKILVLLAVISSLLGLLFAFVIKVDFSNRCELGFSALGSLFLLSAYVCNDVIRNNEEKENK